MVFVTVVSSVGGEKIRKYGLFNFILVILLCSLQAENRKKLESTIRD